MPGGKKDMRYNYQISADEVVKEIARISSGEVNEITLKYASELRNKKAS